MLNSPAAQQMLLLRATGATGGVVGNTFLDGPYRNMVTFPTSQPAPYRFVAVSLGSQCGIQTLQSHEEILNFDGGFFVGISYFLTAGIRASAVVNALPNYGPSARLSRLKIYFREQLPFGIASTIDFNQTISRQSYYSPANVPNWDGAPGGTQSLVTPEHDMSTPIGIGGVGLSIDYDVQGAPRFCLVPTVSALDIAGINSASISGSYVNGLASTSFSRADNFLAQTTGLDSRDAGRANYQHPFFLGRQSHWLFNELENVANNNVACGSNSCTVAPPPIVIDGPQNLCNSSGIYTAPIIAGATYQWTTSPAGVFTPATGSGLTFTTSAGATPGIGQIMLSVSSTCLNLSASTSKDVGICPGLGVNLVFNGYTNSGTNRDNYAQWTATGTGGAGSYTYMWSTCFTANAQYSSAGCGFNSTGVITPTFGICMNNQTPGLVRVRVRDAAGNTVVADGIVRSQARPVAYSPNPANDVLSIQLDATDGSQSATVRLFDAQGTLQAEQVSSDNTIQVNTQALPEGLYFLHVTTGEEVLLNEQFKIQH